MGRRLGALVGGACALVVLAGCAATPDPVRIACQEITDAINRNTDQASMLRDLLHANNASSGEVDRAVERVWLFYDTMADDVEAVHVPVSGTAPGLQSKKDTLVHAIRSAAEKGRAISEPRTGHGGVDWSQFPGAAVSPAPWEETPASRYESFVADVGAMADAADALEETCSPALK